MQLNLYKFYEKYFKNMALIILILIILFLVMKSCQGEKIRMVPTASIQKDYTNEIKIWKDKYNREHITVKEIRLSRDQFRVEVQRITELLNIKEGSIAKVTGIITKGEFKGQLEVETISKSDSTNRNPNDLTNLSTIFKYRELPWINLKGELGTNNLFTLEINDTLMVTNYSKRKWFLSPRRYFTDVSGKNPYIKIKGVQTLGESIKDPTFIIAPSISLGYGLDSRVYPTAGVSIIYYPLSIKIK